ncbi:chemotaxis protein methyltransferase CheR [Hathewaya proteolytica DSM 3090]|uniref:protein-glutamate O-methyltransferase n=1 Tax=Hathewaya proteolytica DSM 3090 TaxID=1121331 RepID=A0A1M6LCJ8_9CLOT|nr:protein-glutamate O-methyltransferase CheR [Hathewaya proteolytica]SHJ68917.1 chemotaxis protein methyltransferase CheR [Hathewaya proteolytica DSM 3090]
MDFDYLGKWVKKEYGIDFTAYKSNQLHRRINSFMERLGINNAQDFVAYMDKNPQTKQKFMDFITINVTEFFRNPDIFKEFEDALTDYIKSRSGRINIWSAACSNGSEPYSIAMIVKNMNTPSSTRILATDIDATILKKAKEGIYTNAEIKNIKMDFLRKYFDKIDDKYKVKTEIKNLVTFKRHDLINDIYEKDFDAIISRNVVIYFNEEAKERIYTRFSQSLKQGGLLFVGATESIYSYRKYGFEKVSTFIYKKI